MCPLSPLGLDLGEYIGLTEDQQFLTVDLDLGAAVFAVQDLVALGDVRRDALAGVLADLAVPDGHDLALLGLFLRGVGQNDPAHGRFFLLDRAHNHAIAEGLELHEIRPPVGARLRRFGTLGPRVPTTLDYSATPRESWRAGQRARGPRLGLAGALNAYEQVKALPLSITPDSAPCAYS